MTTQERKSIRYALEVCLDSLHPDYEKRRRFPKEELQDAQEKARLGLRLALELLTKEKVSA